MFWEQGWDYVSVESVAKAAGVSKGTVFNAFDSKLGLVEALVDRTADLFSTVVFDDDDTADAETRLNLLGCSLLPLLISKEVIALEATLPPLANRYPALLEKLGREGIAKTNRRLSQHLAKIFRAGRLDIQADRETVESLVCLWQGSLPDSLRMGLQDMPDSTEIARRVRKGTAIFLRGMT